jgi:hypothetical protein
VYDKCYQAGESVRTGEVAETTEIGDWKMPDFKRCCAHAASQGWLVVEGDCLTLTNAGITAI